MKAHFPALVSLPRRLPYVASDHGCSAGLTASDTMK